ncbi:hypothetical protein CBS101457_005793 [Exobasidium rhododendri]|nr:hypothetical protein CBS101457_005793 [Exobasidium rhododendri]
MDTYESDRRTMNYHSDADHWTGHNFATGPSSSPMKANFSDTGRMSSSPDVSRDDDGDARKKRRIQQACKACSLRRVKCDGAKPCQTCLRNNDECIYGQPKKRGPAKGTTRGGRRDEHGTSSSTTIAKTTTTSSAHDSPSYARPRSPNSFHSAANVLALKRPPDQAPHSSLTVNSEGPGVTFRGQSEATSHAFAEGTPMNPPSSSLYDRSWPPSSEMQKAPSVYRGSTSGWNTAPTSYRSSHRDDVMAFPSQSSHSSLKYEATNSSRAPRNWSSQHAGSGRELTAPRQQNGNGHRMDLAPASHPEYPPSASPMTAPHSVSHHNGEHYDSRHASPEESVVDELEVVEASLEDIFHELHEGRQKAANKSGGSKSLNGKKLLITIQRPDIGQEVKTQLFHFFWSNILIHWPLFYRNRQNYDDEDAARERTEANHPLLFNAICSISALSRSEGDRDRTSNQKDKLSYRQMSTVFYARARYYNIRASQNPCLESAAALVLLSLRESGAGHSTEANQYCWSACRMALDLGLHRHGELSQSSETSIGQVEDENRRRVFWCAYVLDKTLAAQFGRPPILRSAESDCPFPSIHGEEDVEWMSWERVRYHSAPNQAKKNKPLNEKRASVSSYFINGCQLAVICESIIEKYNVVQNKQHDLDSWQKDEQNSHSQICALHLRLTRWMEATPKHLKWSPDESAVHLPLVLHQQTWAQVCMILIHRPYILKGCGESTINSHAECSKATEKICVMFRDWERQYDIRALPSGSVYCLFTAATIALANTTSMEIRVATTAKDQLVQYLRWLKMLSLTWTSATHHITILQRLVAGIDPRLAEDTTTVSQGVLAAVERNGDGLHTPTHSYNSVISKADRDVQWAQMGGHSAPSRGSRKDIPYHEGQTAAHSVSGVDDIPSVDAFWNDMPLGENFQRWDHFTQAYFKSAPNNFSDGAPF